MFPEVSRRHLWAALLVFLVGAAGFSYTAHFLDASSNVGLSDFSVYHYIPKAVFSGRPLHPYTNTIPIYAYFLPPAALILVYPWHLITYYQAMFVWTSLSLAAWLGFIWLLSRSLKLEKSVFPWILLILASVYGPLTDTFNLGQLNTFILFFLTAAFFFYQQGKDIGAGIFLGLGAVLKISPLMLLILPLLQKRYRVIISCLLTVITLSLLAEWLVFPGVNYHYLRYVLDDVSKQGGDFLRDQSLLALLQQIRPIRSLVDLVNDHYFHLSPPKKAVFYSLLNYAIVGVGFLGVIRSLIKTKLSEKLTAGHYSLILLLAFMGTGLTWYHHYVLALFPLGVVLAAIITSLNKPKSQHQGKPTNNQIPIGLLLGWVVSFILLAVNGDPIYWGRVRLFPSQFWGGILLMAVTYLNLKHIQIQTPTKRPPLAKVNSKLLLMALVIGVALKLLSVNLPEHYRWERDKARIETLAYLSRFFNREILPETKNPFSGSPDNLAYGSSTDSGLRLDDGWIKTNKTYQHKFQKRLSLMLFDPVNDPQHHYEFIADGRDYLLLTRLESRVGERLMERDGGKKNDYYEVGNPNLLGI